VAVSTTNGHDYKVIGTRPIRHDGVDKVTGRAKYGADYTFPGMLFGKVLRSPHAHALIKSINVDQALALPGVKAVVTSADLPELADKMEAAGEATINLTHLSANILARGKALYDGHAIAAVAATSPHIAEEALRLIEVEYEMLPPVMSVEDAMKPGAPILLPTLRNKEDGPDKETAQDALRQLKERVAKTWEKKAEEIVFADGLFSPVSGNGVKPMTLKQLAPRLARTGGPIIGRATVNAGGVGPAFATTLVDVEVDPDTGKVKILRATVAQDVGKAIHPAYVEGQMQGGTAQGIGWALNEEYFYDDKGILRNTGLLDYRMPTCLDLPEIETIMVEVPTPGHPLGIRGVGEVPIVPPPAAVANAIYHATGVRMTELPMSPPRLLKAMLKKRATHDSQAAAAD